MPTSGPRGPDLRRLVALADGTADGTPEPRLGEAQAWRIVAASTDDERVRAALVAAAVTVEPVDRTALDRAIDRAGRRPDRGAYATDGAWHFLNVEPPATLVDHPRVSVHRVEARPTALRRLHDAVKGRTALEMSFDPFLDDAVAALGGPTVHLYVSPMFAPLHTFAGRLQLKPEHGTGALELGVVVPTQRPRRGPGVRAQLGLSRGLGSRPARTRPLRRRRREERASAARLSPRSKPAPTAPASPRRPWHPRPPSPRRPWHPRPLSPHPAPPAPAPGRSRASARSAAGAPARS